MEDKQPDNAPGQALLTFGKTFGRAGGRPLSTRQKGFFADLYPRIEIPIAPANSLDPSTLFDHDPAEIWFEIGFGGGEHLTGQAQRHPQIGSIGVEPFAEGVGKALTQISELELTNVRLNRGDARDVLLGLKDETLDRIFIMFPDPWPKTRHHKRRIVQHDSVALFVSKLKPGGRLRFATDVMHYADWALERFCANDRLDWTATAADDWRIPPQDHVTTRYQTKNLGDCKPVYFDFIRL
ncbi:MAG: tRNA (guanosine(46)-N7)-methyltransferase TrmB [Hirschia sp.]|nr:tRNA (guanosine(46)-N7)-methyltransferase TrmB [Hirschia sp.]MBF18636.1 tRNA (guanosine(46)-N7)-methyltransferase TrmB [Hirschia sp.]|tara:strand:- start:294 stop:1010 length:717 start_codon:yes stop_codon:yes gene_type:complete